MASLRDPAAYLRWVEQNQEQQRQAQNRRNPMRYKTKRGDSIALPSPTKPLRDHADSVYAEAVETFDQIQEVKRRNEALNRVNSVDRRRFPAAGGEQ